MLSEWIFCINLKSAQDDLKLSIPYRHQWCLSIWLLLKIPSGFVHLIWWSVKRQPEESRTDKMKNNLPFLKKRRGVGASRFRPRTKATPICLNYCGPNMRKLHMWLCKKTTWALRSKRPELNSVTLWLCDVELVTSYDWASVSWSVKWR